MLKLKRSLFAIGAAVAIGLLLNAWFSWIGWAQEAPPVPKIAPQAAAKPTATPGASPKTTYPLSAQEVSDLATLRRDFAEGTAAFTAAVNKVLTCKFESTAVLESVGQLREVNQAATGAQQRLESWIVSHRPADCADCVLSADLKHWERRAVK